MNRSEFTIIGVMSGTSLDGLDLAKVRFSFDKGQWDFKFLEGTTVSFSDKLYHQLSICMNLSGLELTKLDIQLGQFIGNSIKNFGVRGVDAVASHGHTVFHNPSIGLTHQIGSLNEIHAISTLPIVGDFRTLDVALGGQGAPLVPVGDAALFSEYDATLNFGGIANITILKESLRAFDICPLNQVSNFLSKKHFGYDFDKSGTFGKQGTVHNDLLNYFNSYSFYTIEGPKSLGKEDVDAYFISTLSSFEVTSEDVLRTYYEHVAIQIARYINDHELKTILCTGGGVYNSFLLSLITEKIKINGSRLILPEENVIEYKEAIIFAFLGLLRLLERNNISKKVTGASTDVMGGVLVGENPFIEK